MRSSPWFVPGVVIFVALVGAGGTVYTLRSSSDTVAPPAFPTSDTAQDGRPKISETGPYPKAVLDKSSTYDFGRMEVGTSQTRTWTIRNEGEADLILVKGRTTCQCTVADLKNDRVPPGGEAQITLDWEPTSQTEHFDKGAEFYTNDPNNRTLTFSLVGKVAASIELRPEPFPSWNLGEIKETEPKSMSGILYSELYEFDITGVETSQPWVKVTWEPADDAELKNHDARGGYELTVTFEPFTPPAGESLELGQFTERVKLKLDGHSEEYFSFPVRGVRTGPISLRPINGGARWHSEALLLDLGSLKRGTGREVTLLLEVRDAGDDFEVTSIVPSDPVFETELTTLTVSKKRKVRSYRLTIKVPDSRPKMSFSRQNPANIVLKTNHGSPAAREVRLRVTFDAL